MWLLATPDIVQGVRRVALSSHAMLRRNDPRRAGDTDACLCDNDQRVVEPALYARTPNRMEDHT